MVDIGDEEEGKNVQSNEGFFSEYSKNKDMKSRDGTSFIITKT